MRSINVLSLFGGVEIGYAALNKLGIKVNNYYSSEIDKYAIQVSRYNFPDIIELGTVTDWNYWDINWNSIDLLLAGFPCQPWSLSGKQEGDGDLRGQLMWDMLDIRNHIQSLNPELRFMFENVKMKQDFQDYINKAIGYYPTLLNSSLVSAQNRNRLFWSNMTGISQPEDRHIYLKDILENNVDEKYYLSQKLLDGFNSKKERRKHLNSGFDSINICDRDGKASTLTARYYKQAMSDPYVIGRLVNRRLDNEGVRKDNNTDIDLEQMIELRDDQKSGTLTTVQKDNILIYQLPRGFNKGGCYKVYGKSPPITTSYWGHNNILAMQKHKSVVSSSKPKPQINNLSLRRLTPTECERLQTFPKDFTKYGIDDKGNKVEISDTQKYKLCGNSWTLEIIINILKCFDNDLYESDFMEELKLF